MTMSKMENENEGNERKPIIKITEAGKYKFTGYTIHAGKFGNSVILFNDNDAFVLPRTANKQFIEYVAPEVVDRFFELELKQRRSKNGHNYLSITRVKRGKMRTPRQTILIE